MDISIEKIVNRGITPDVTPGVEKCIRLCNTSGLILAIGLIPYMILYGYHQLYTVFTTITFLIVFNLFVPYLNLIGCHKSARASFVIVNYSVGFINSTILGQDAFIYLYLIVGLPTAVMLFQFKEYFLQLICLNVSVLLIVFDLVFCVIPFFQYDLSTAVLEHIRFVAVLGSLSCLLLFILFFREERDSAERNFDQLVISKQILKNDMDAIFFCDMDGRIKFANQSAELLYGYTLDELIGRNLASFYRRAENRAYLQKSFAETLNWRGETELSRKDGSTFSAFFTQFVVTDDKGLSVGMAASVKDITYQKQTELALIDAKEKAEEAAAVKANFLATMSHEIRTPLNGVIGITHLLLEDDPKPEHIESLNILKFAGENLLTLINDVLDFSKIDAGRITLEAVPFSLSELVNSIKSSSQYLAFEKGIKFDVRLDKQLEQRYQGDPVRLTQILLNLTSNAIKFTQVGGVTLSVAVIRRDDQQDDIEFKILDTGIGIAKDKLEHIFEQFSQADNTITRHYGGSGLGLSITKGLLEAFGAEIGVESEEGTGTTFSFMLTMKKTSSDQPLPPSKYFLEHCNAKNDDIGSMEELSGLSVLVAEDNPVNVMVIQKWLTKWGVKIEIVKNGEEAVQKIREKQYDLVLMDIQMPVMDGFQATLAIRSLMGGAPLPIIALTATTTDEFVAEAYDVGMNDYLGKPFNPSHLKSKIKQLCLS